MVKKCSKVLETTPTAPGPYRGGQQIFHPSFPRAPATFQRADIQRQAPKVSRLTQVLAYSCPSPLRITEGYGVLNR